MSKIDEIYKDVVMKIINEGEMQRGNVRAKYADGTPAYTKYIHNVNFTIKPEDGFPILQSKRVAWKTAFKEIDWIWRQLSNDVDALEAMGVKIWSDWKKPDGTIGRAYGHILGRDIWRPITGLDGTTHYKEVNQVEYVLNEIVRSPRSRRIMTNLFEVEHLSDMALEPCVYGSNWNVDDNNKLHLFVKQRSADILLGLPFNISQYAMLHRRIAQVTGKELGSMHWVIDNAHIYDRHLETAEEQVTADISHLEEYKPKLILPKSLQYFDAPLHEATIENYHHNGNFKFELAI